jgi:hypothetical protein
MESQTRDRGFSAAENGVKLTTPGQAASEYETTKRKHYKEVPHLYPCIIETLGRWGTGMKFYFNKK